MRPIGYYVHHHGDGHRQRALAIAARAPDRFTLLGTGLRGRTGGIKSIDLPDDRLDRDSFDAKDGEEHRSHAMHYAPLRHDGTRSRMTAIAQWIAVTQPALIVVDVSVEVALLARLCATPVAYVLLAGRRNDTPHLEAFRAASVLIVPFAQVLEDPETPDWVRRKSYYAPGVVGLRVMATPEVGRVLVVSGSGGSQLSPAQIIDAARRTAHHRWRVIGLACDETNLPPNLVFAGWTDNPELEIARADVVIGGAGDGLVSAVLAARRPFVCIPEHRPFNEQVQKAIALKRASAAIVLERWPDVGQWSGILNDAHAIDPSKQAVLDDPDGPQHLANRLIEIADRQK